MPDIQPYTYDEYGQPHDATGAKVEPYNAPDPSLGQSLKNIAWSPVEMAKSAVLAPYHAAKQLFGTPSTPGTFGQGPDYPGNASAMRDLLASIYVHNTINPAAAVPDGALGMFAGQKSKTADQAALAKAQDMHASGAEPAQIWNDTGWFKGPDDKWKYEIDDSNSKWNLGRNLAPAQSINGPMSNALDHPELASAYPAIANLPTQYVNVSHPPAGSPLGSYRPGQGIVVRDMGGAFDPRSTSLHELQHAIQDQDGFGYGSNPARFPADKLKQEAFENHSRSIQDLMAQDPEAAEIYRARNRFQVQRNSASGKDVPWSDSDVDKLIDFDDRLSKYPIGRQLQDADYTRNSVQSYPDDYWRNIAMQRYRDQSGEVEARNVQARMNMTPDQRRAAPPWETQDTPYDKQIVQFKADGGIVYDEYGQPHDSSGAKIEPSDQPAPSLSQSLKNIAISPYEMAKSAVMAPINAAQHLFGPNGHFWEGPSTPGFDQNANSQAMRDLLFSFYGGNAFSPMKAAEATAAKAPLAMDEASRMARAQQQGFDVSKSWYHGTDHNFDAFDYSKLGQGGGGDIGNPISSHGAFFTDDPEYAAMYGKNVMPVYLKGNYPEIYDPIANRPEAYDNLDIKSEVLGTLKRGGLDGVTLTGPGTYPERIAFDPANIRSTAAAFNSADVGKSGLLLSDTGKANPIGAAIAGADNPLRVYHGTQGDISGTLRPESRSMNSDPFLGDIETTRHGPFFSDNPNVSSEYGNAIYPADLHAENIADVSSLRDAYTDSIDPFNDRDAWLAAKYAPNDWQMFEGDRGKRFTDWLRNEGYDAAKFYEEAPNAPGVDGTTYVPLQPNTVKSATTGETLFSDTGKANPIGAALAGQLPMDEASRLARAREMGFDTDQTWYHGTPDARGIMENGFQTLKQRYGHDDPEAVYFAAKDPRVARTYADDSRAFDYQNAEPATLPLYMNPGKQFTLDWGGKPFRGKAPDDTGYNIHDYIDKARNEGYDSFRINNVVDTYDAKGRPSTIAGTFDPSRFRHPDAAFNPADKDKAGLLLSDTSKPSVPGLLAAGAESPQDMLNRVYGDGGKGTPPIQPSQEFNFIRNTDSGSKYRSPTDDYLQSVEPSGRYMSHVPELPNSLPDGWESGTHKFSNPLYLDWGSGGYKDPDSWKRILSDKYGGKKGKALSQAVRNDGYDGIVTMQGSDPSEIVDLSMFNHKKK